MLHKKFSSAGEVSKQIAVGVPLVLSAQPGLKGPLNAQLKQFLQDMTIVKCLPPASQCDGGT